MLEKVLLAVDQSEHSRKTIPAAVELARAGGGAVHVLHVRELHYPAPPTVPGESLQEAQQLVDGVVEELKAAGVTAEGPSGRAPEGPQPVPSWGMPVSWGPA